MITSINRLLYIGFLFVGLFHWLFSKDYIEASASFAIALIFDPFNVDQNWKDRPYWQKAVLIAHLALAAAMLGIGIGLNDK